MNVKLVNDAQALLSMRESDFDSYSAYGEAVDNSIQATAKNIHIEFTTSLGARGYKWIEEVAFIDDGHGMNEDILHRCLQFGYSSRFNDRNGIGRFGVGMTLGAIHECMRVEVYSKTASKPDWFMTYIDLSNLDPKNSNSQIEISAPILALPPEKYLQKINKESGTVIIWKKYDRQKVSAEKIIEETKIYLGRTFRYYLWEGVALYVNSEKVFAIDPLYANTSLTKYPQDPKAEVFQDIEVDWDVPEPDASNLNIDKSKITIRLSLLPEQFRPNQGSGNSKEAESRFINRNQGISILRKKREVFYGPIPYWPGKSDFFAEISRWWGCEINFDPILDRAFEVKNIKRGAVPSSELKQTIYEKIEPTVKHCLEKVRATWDANRKVEEQQQRTDPTDTGHSPAEKKASSVTTDSSYIPVADPEKAVTDLLQMLKKGKSKEEQAAWAAKWRSQPFTIMDENWNGKEFMELKPLGGNDVLLYNRAHPFMQELYGIIEKLNGENGADLELSKKLKCLIDLLLLSHCKAQSKFDLEEKYLGSDYIEILNMNWGQYLKSYVREQKENG